MSENQPTVDSILSGYFGNQAKNNQVLLNVIDIIVRQAKVSEQNYQNAVKEIEKLKKGKNK